MEDHQFVNSVTESNTKVIEKLMEAFAKSQEQMATLMSKLSKNPTGGGHANGGTQLTKDEKCPKCKCKKHQGGVSECWADPKNADKHPQWYKGRLERKAKKDAEKKS